MNCADARFRFSQLTLPVPGDDPAMLDAARRHLEQCDECRSALESELSVDAKLARQMRAVPLPPEYDSVLRRCLPVSTPGTTPARRPAARRWLALTTACVLLLGIGVLLRMWALSVATLDVEKLLLAIDRQRMIGEVTNQLEDQKKFVDLLASGILGPESSVTPSDQELQQFGRQVDTIPIQLAALERISEPGARDSVALLREHAEDLAQW